MTITIKDAKLAEKGRRLFSVRGKVRFSVGSSELIDLPNPVKEILEQALNHIAEGKGVAIVPEQTELTTQQAADVLNVSRPFVVNLLENGEMPFRKIGRHRRVLAADVFKYKEISDKKRLSVLAKLTAEAQELGLGY